MTLKTFVRTALLGLAALPVTGFSANLTCSSFQGSLTLTPDPVCEITQLKARSKWFPDVTFLTDLGVANSCFVGQVDGMLGNEVLSGKSISGQTLHAYPQNPNDPANILFTAVTVVKTRGAQGQRTGNIYFRDTGMLNLANGVAHEQLVIIGGTRRFHNARGTLSIAGNEFIGAPVSGQICIEADEE